MMSVLELGRDLALGAQQKLSAQCSFFQGARALSYNFPGIEVLYKSVYISKL
jgi:hypothetical protein